MEGSSIDDSCSRKHERGATHIIAFPFPSKGHINPMLHLCNLLVSKGLRVTIIYTASTIKSAKSSSTGLSFNSIHTETISDGITRKEDEEDEADVEAYFKQFKDIATQGLTDVVNKHQRSNHPPRLVLYDSVMPWLLDVAHGLGLRGASFFTQSASVCAIYYHMRLQAQQQQLNDPAATLLAAAAAVTKTAAATTFFPLMPPLERKDLPGFDYFLDIKIIVEKLLLDQFSNIEEVDYILFNTYQKLEDKVISWMANQWPPVKTIGPTAPPIVSHSQQQQQARGGRKWMKKNGAGKQQGQEDCRYLFETNTEACLKWLDGKEGDSVVYISFGSVASLSEEQMGEVAQGINNCDCNFLWVVRDEEDWKLPKSFKTETCVEGNKGLVINWCPQLHVLAHKAVACFMTHCGWNSTLEGLSSGVPMIAVPQWVDQTTNAKFIADVWEAGVRAVVDHKLGMVTSTEIERCIRQVTRSERGLELKRNAIKWKKYANEAVEQGGSSERNVQDFVSSLLHLI